MLLINLRTDDVHGRLVGDLVQLLLSFCREQAYSLIMAQHAVVHRCGGHVRFLHQDSVKEL